MVYTYRGLQDQVLRLLDEAGNSTTREVVKDLMNQAHLARCQSAKWPFLLQGPYTFTTESGVIDYTLHQEFDRAHSFWNRTAQDWVRETPHRQLEPDGLYNMTQGTAANCALWGRWPVRAQPSSASVLTLVSNHASDTGADYAVVVKGETADGDVRPDLITPNGTTPVAGSVAFTKILGITKSQASNGTFTLTSNSGAVTNLTLSPWEMGKSYPVLRVLEEPMTTETIDYQFYRNALVLVNDYDIPDLPGQHAQLLVFDVLMLIAGYVADIPASALVEWSRMQKQMEQALWQSQMEAQSVAARPRTVRFVEQ